MQGFLREYSPDNLSTFDVARMICDLYMSQEKYDKAEDIFQRNLKRCEEVLGPEHLITLYTKVYRGKLLWIQRKHVEAKETLH